MQRGNNNNNNNNTIVALKPDFFCVERIGRTADTVEYELLQLTF